MKTLLLALIAAALVFSVAGAQKTYGQPPPPAPMADLILTAGELTAAVEKGTTLFGDELVPAGPGDATLTSDVITAPIPFNAVVPQWTGTSAEAIEFRVRTSPDGVNWGDWIAVHANHDWMEPGDEEVVGEMVLVPDTSSTHEYVQVQVLFNAHPIETDGDKGESPALRQLRLTFIDSTEGPTTDELVSMQEQIDENTVLPESLTAFPKPPVVSRSVWCQNPDCVYTDGLEYHPVSHLIVHHTVSNNASSDWAAVVRAIWNFHTYSRGWGDIGYNYLVDPNGVIYEGHYGGDDVVGTHASGANKGSMAVALLGTFTRADESPPGIRPPDPMLNSAADLLAWKADQRDINVFEASRSLPNIDWGLPHLMGHRDVYGTTACPGDQAHVLIPWLRDQIAARLGQTNPYLYTDELSTGFIKSSSANWFVPPYLCGFNNHAWYTWSTTNPASGGNWGEWRPNVPATGRYRIDVYVPYCRTGRAETQGATYTITHADGTSTRVINQNANVGLWITLGEYNLNQGNGNVIRLTDVTTTDSGVGVWFDALRLLPVGTPPPPPPTVTNVDPPPNAMRTNRTVAFAWQVANPQTVQMTTLQVATDPNFNNTLINQSWLGVVSAHSHTFSADYADLHWRVLLTRANAPLISSVPTRFTLDATPPTSAVRSPVYYLPVAQRYAIEWSGQDALSGVDRYHIDYRTPGQPWTRWLTDTKLKSALFDPPDDTLVYEFRSQAVDKAGNVEPAQDAADATTAQAIRLTAANVLPIILR